MNNVGMFDWLIDFIFVVGTRIVHQSPFQKDMNWR